MATFGSANLASIPSPNVPEIGKNEWICPLNYPDNRLYRSNQRVVEHSDGAVLVGERFAILCWAQPWHPANCSCQPVGVRRRHWIQWGAFHCRKGPICCSGRSFQADEASPASSQNGKPYNLDSKITDLLIEKPGIHSLPRLRHVCKLTQECDPVLPEIQFGRGKDAFPGLKNWIVIGKMLTNLNPILLQRIFERILPRSHIDSSVVVIVTGKHYVF